MSNTQNTTYNEWTNYETWNCALWIDNDQGMQEMVAEWAKEFIDDEISKSEDIGNIRQSASYGLAEKLKDYHFNDMQEMSDMKVIGVFASLLNNALSQISFYEIAEHYINDVELYSAGYNMPGYMPDNTPSIFTDSDDAFKYIKDTIEQSLDDDDSVSDEELKGITESLKQDENGEFGQTIGQYHYFISKM